MTIAGQQVEPSRIGLPAPGRLPALDGLRGAAALSVVGYHMTLILPNAGGWKNLPMLGAMWNGH